MKKSLLFSALAFAFLVVFVACEEAESVDEGEKEATEEKLSVKFENHPSSPYAITGIYLLNMGVAGDLPEPTGEFGDNILVEGESIEPGAYKMFDLDIPNTHFAYCKLAIDKGDGVSVRLDDQEGYTNKYDGTITHWGSHERTVTATLTYIESSDRVIVWWSEWAGIE